MIFKELRRENKEETARAVIVILPTFISPVVVPTTSAFRTTAKQKSWRKTIRRRRKNSRSCRCCFLTGSTKNLRTTLANGKDMDHRSAVDRERTVSEYCFDYCFPGDELGFKLTVLVGKERLTGMKFATAVPTKGASGKFATDRCLEFIGEVGDAENKVIVKNDQEPSIQYLVKDLVSESGEGKIILEESPVKSSGSNGVVERCVLGC